jgi:ADP-ribose pyrophosphatase YjhB (NUDIX family)
MHSKFICGITGVVRDDDGRVLLLRHRLWPPGQQWGFPGGYANKGERHENTIAREVREETGLTVKAGRLLKVSSGFRYRIEVYYEAVLVGGLAGLELDPREILEARLFSVSDLPAGMPETHRELAVARLATATSCARATSTATPGLLWCDPSNVPSWSSRHPLRFIGIMWISGAALVLLLVVLLSIGDGHSANWGLAIPLALVIPSVGIVGPIYGLRQRAQR